MGHSDEESIQSECEEDFVDWGVIHDPLQAEAKDIISKRVKAIRLIAKRNAAKKIAEARFLWRKRGKTVGKILKECPDIGTTIESYVKGACGGQTASAGLASRHLMGTAKLIKRQHLLGLKLIWKKITIKSLSMEQWFSLAWLGTSDVNLPSGTKGLRE